MPAYFKFLTVMAFHVFLGEKVDVAILEVGIGGEHDCTNIVRYRHRNATESNWFLIPLHILFKEHQNCGHHISRTGSYTAARAHTRRNRVAKVWNHQNEMQCVCHQSTAGMPWNVTQSSNGEKCKLFSGVNSVHVSMLNVDGLQAKLQWVPDFSAYDWRNSSPLTNPSPAHRLNGSLAIQLAYDWMKNNPSKIPNSKITKELARSSDMCLTIFDEVREGFEQCHWPGRFQVVRMGSKKYMSLIMNNSLLVTHSKFFPKPLHRWIAYGWKPGDLHQLV